MCVERGNAISERSQRKDAKRNSNRNSQLNQKKSTPGLGGCFHKTERIREHEIKAEDTQPAYKGEQKRRPVDVYSKRKVLDLKK
jgi:hypothetical protein